jgi:hypothetical protein
MTQDGCGSCWSCAEEVNRQHVEDHRDLAWGGRRSCSGPCGGVLHVGVLVDHRHHLGDCLRVALEHLVPELDVVQPLVEVVDDVPVINLRNRITVSEVPLVVVAEGFVGLLGDTA